MNPRRILRHLTVLFPPIFLVPLSNSLPLKVGRDVSPAIMRPASERNLVIFDEARTRILIVGHCCRTWVQHLELVLRNVGATDLAALIATEIRRFRFLRPSGACAEDE